MPAGASATQRGPHHGVGSGVRCGLCHCCLCPSRRCSGGLCSGALHPVGRCWSSVDSAAQRLIQDGEARCPVGSGGQLARLPTDEGTETDRVPRQLRRRQSEQRACARRGEVELDAVLRAVVSDRRRPGVQAADQCRILPGRLGRVGQCRQPRGRAETQHHGEVPRRQTEVPPRREPFVAVAAIPVDQRQPPRRRHADLALQNRSEDRHSWQPRTTLWAAQPGQLSPGQLSRPRGCCGPAAPRTDELRRRSPRTAHRRASWPGTSPRPRHAAGPRASWPLHRRTPHRHCRSG